MVYFEPGRKGVESNPKKLTRIQEQKSTVRIADCFAFCLLFSVFCFGMLPKYGSINLFEGELLCTQN